SQWREEPAVLVVHAGLEEDALDLTAIGDLKGRQDDGIANRSAQIVGCLHDNFPPLERILVGPLDDVRGALVDDPDERPIDEKADRGQAALRRRLKLRDDANFARDAGPAERRGD